MLDLARLSFDLCHGSYINWANAEIELLGVKVYQEVNAVAFTIKL
jgi:hypothetical protein